MNISEFSKPVTSKRLNESLAKSFGRKINLESFSIEQLYDARNKLRTKLRTIETTESYDKVESEKYQKNKLFMDVLNKEIEERLERNKTTDAPKTKKKKVKMSEGAEHRAEIVMAAKDMVDKLTGWMEHTGELQTESIIELSDAIRDELGVETSQKFVEKIKAPLATLYSTMEQTREILISGVKLLSGEGDMSELDNTMGPEDGVDLDTDADLGAGSDAEDDIDADIIDTADDEEDEFNADQTATGGELETGREKRESKSYNVKKKSMRT
jgi:hypothetical protein